jgi:spermidine synthase
MYKYQGLLIYESHDDEGIIEIVDTMGERALHFGSSARQSSMRLSEPNRLNSLYARAMMASLLFQPEPQDVLMIGLGGGTIAKFLLHQFPDCQIQAVEYRRSVLKVARSHFGLPLDPRLKVRIGCGGEYVDKQSRQASEVHDLLLVDAYDHAGMAEEVSNEAFFDGCRTLLREDGLLAINLWMTDNDQFAETLWRIGRSFDHRVIVLPVRKRGNAIAFALGENVPKFALKTLQSKAIELEARYQLEFSHYLLDLKRYNAPVLHRIFNK